MIVIVILLLIIIIILILFTQQRKYSLQTKEIVNTLLRQSARWSVASEQDQNPLISNLHANYGAGYWWALKDISSNDEIHDITGIDVRQFENLIKLNQYKSVMKALKNCPQYSNQKGLLATIAGEGL
jgi:type II secretory pathway pseudopilin PulG